MEANTFSQDGLAGWLRVHQMELEAVPFQDLGYEVAGLVWVRRDADYADGAAAGEGIFQVFVISGMGMKI